MIASDNYNSNININTDATIGTILSMINNSNIKIPEIAKAFGISRDTFTRRLKTVGYIWDNVNKIYMFDGNLISNENCLDKTQKEIDQIPIKEILAPKRKGRTKSKHKQIKSEPIDTIAKAFNLKSNKRHQIAFYIDQDIKDVLDKIPHGKKSDIINQCLRQVFRTKGLIK